MSAFSKTPNSRDSEITLNIARAVVFVYFGLISFSQFGHDKYQIAIPIVFLSVVISVTLLEQFRYDLRSSIVILIATCQIYFFGRIDFISKNWGWYYIIGQAAYLSFLIGLLTGVLIFSKYSIRRVKNYFANKASAEKQRFKINRLYYLCVTSFVLYLFGLNYLLNTVGVAGSFFGIIYQALNTRLKIAEIGLSPILQGMYILSALGIGCAFVLWHRSRHHPPIIAWLMLIVYSGLVLGSRGAIVFPLIQILLATSLLVKRPLRMLMIVIVPLLITVNLFSTWYLGARQGQYIMSNEMDSIFYRFDAYSNWLDLSSAKGIEILPGDSIRKFLFQFLPRQLYPEKPYYFSTDMTRLYLPQAFANGINLDFGGIAESVYNFGPFGPAVFGLFLGWIGCRIDQYKHHAYQMNDATSAYIYSQGAVIPASFFFIGWINTPMIFVIIGFYFTIKIMRFVSGDKLYGF